MFSVKISSTSGIGIKSGKTVFGLNTAEFFSLKISVNKLMENHIDNHAD